MSKKTKAQSPLSDGDECGMDCELAMAEPPAVKPPYHSAFEVSSLAILLATKEGRSDVEHYFTRALDLLNSAKRFLWKESRTASIKATEALEKECLFSVPEKPNFYDFDYLTEIVQKETPTSPAQTRCALKLPGLIPDCSRVRRILGLVG